jgi:hypothetical protein
MATLLEVGTELQETLHVAKKLTQNGQKITQN